MNCRCPRPLPNLQPGFEAALAGSITRRKMMLLCDSKPTHSTPLWTWADAHYRSGVGGNRWIEHARSILFPGSWVRALGTGMRRIRSRNNKKEFRRCDFTSTLLLRAPERVPSSRGLRMCSRRVVSHQDHFLTALELCLTRSWYICFFQGLPRVDQTIRCFQQLGTIVKYYVINRG